MASKEELRGKKEALEWVATLMGDPLLGYKIDQEKKDIEKRLEALEVNGKGK
tara:strand:+ start:422 stop:577 length:156 start_codon:yes stop_codon:yes gene_type:complete